MSSALSKTTDDKRTIGPDIQGRMEPMTTPEWAQQVGNIPQSSLEIGPADDQGLKPSGEIWKQDPIQNQSLGELCGQDLEEIPFGASASSETFKKAIITSQKIIIVKYHGKAITMAFSPRLSFDSLMVLINNKFKNPAAPITSLYQDTGECIAEIEDIGCLRERGIYYALDINDKPPFMNGLEYLKRKLSPEEEDFYERLRAKMITAEGILLIKEVFAEQKITFPVLMCTGDLAMTEAKLKECGIKKGGLRMAILSVIRSYK